MPPATLHALVSSQHRHLDELMLLHQEALLLQDIPLATRFLDLFDSLLSAHIEAENQHLIPALARQPSPRWSALLYQKEHEKITAMLQKIQTQLQALPGLTGQPLRRAILALLDYERAFKNVMEHHEEREETGLLRELDAALPEAETRHLIQTLQPLWDPLVRQQQNLLPALVAALQQPPSPPPQFC